MGNYHREIGATELSVSNRIYLSLRSGRLSENRSEPFPGSIPWKTVNKAGKESHFHTKQYKDIYGYVKRVATYTKEIDGQGGKIKISGVQIDVDCGDKLFCIDLSKQDAPYGRVIASLAECDFRSPVLFMAFTDETKRKKMFVAQAFNDEGKPMYIRPEIHQEKWLSTQLSNTLKAMAKEVAKGAKWSDLLQDLSEKDRRNVAVDEQGAPLSSSQYPYIRQLSDGTWDSTAWMERLYEVVQEEIAPAVQEAARFHPVIQTTANGSEPEYSGSETSFDEGFEPADDDTDIPF